MATTITAVADRIQLTLSDAAASVWPQASVEAWVKEAILEYSQHFHRTLYDTIAAVTDQRQYDLNNNFLAAERVEYPKDEDPPEFLDPISRRDPRFWAGDTFYDVERSDSDLTFLPQLWISPKPTTGEEIYVTYRATFWDSLQELPYICHVPDEHQSILDRFVIWKACTERLMLELQEPDRSIHLVTDMQHAADSARKAYDQALDRAKKARSPSQVTRAWAQDAYDRVY